MFRKRTLQERFWEILPGLELWVVLIGAISLSFIRPVWAALFIICFDFYWLLRAINGSAHLVSSYFKFQVMVKIDWLDYINRLKRPERLYWIFKNKPSVNGTEAKYIKHEIKRLNDFLNKGLVFPNYENFYHCILIPFVNESVEVISAGWTQCSQTITPKTK